MSENKGLFDASKGKKIAEFSSGSDENPIRVTVHLTFTDKDGNVTEYVTTDQGDNDGLALKPHQITSKRYESGGNWPTIEVNFPVPKPPVDKP